MCIDSSVAVITSGMILTFYAVGIQNSFMCFEITFSFLNFTNLMVVYNVITAYIRYKRVLTSMNNQNWKTEKQLILITTILLGSLAMLSLVLLIIDVALEMEWFAFYTNCLGNTTGMSWLGLATHVVRVSVILCTIPIEVKCLKLLRRISDHPNPSAINQAPQQQGHLLHDIPMRSTMINFGYILCHLIFIPVANQTGQQLIIGSFAALLVLLLKSPLIIFWTFRVNTTNARIDQDQLREERRQLELKEALEKREARRKNQSSNIPSKPSFFIVFVRAPSGKWHVNLTQVI